MKKVPPPACRFPVRHSGRRLPGAWSGPIFLGVSANFFHRIAETPRLAAMEAYTGTRCRLMVHLLSIQRRTNSLKSSWLEHCSGSRTSVTRTTWGVPCSEPAGMRYRAPSPLRTQKGLIHFFANSFMCHSAGMDWRRRASETDDCLTSRKSASSTWVLHPAASNTRWYWAVKTEETD